MCVIQDKSSKLAQILNTVLYGNKKHRSKTCVVCLGPWPLNSWQNSTPILCKALVCRSFRTIVLNLQKYSTVLYCTVLYCTVHKKCLQHTSDTCHVSGTLSNKYLVHLEPELEIIRYLEQTLESWNYGFGEVAWFYLIANFFVFAVTEKAKALLYTNMTPTKTLDH